MKDLKRQENNEEGFILKKKNIEEMMGFRICVGSKRTCSQLERRRKESVQNRKDEKKEFRKGKSKKGYEQERRQKEIVQDGKEDEKKKSKIRKTNRKVPEQDRIRKVSV